MSAVNWGLLQPSDPGAAFAAGRDQGLQRNALQAYVAAPTDAGRTAAIGDLTAVNPALAFQLQDRQAAQANALRVQQRQDAADQAAAQEKGRQIVAGVLSSVRRTIQDPEQRRQALAHVVDQLRPMLPPQQGDELAAMVTTLDTTDQGMDATLGALGAAPKPQIVQTRQGSVIEVTPGQTGAPTVLYQQPEDPLDAQKKQAEIDYLRAGVDQRGASAAHLRRAPVGRGRGGGGGGGGVAGLPPGARIVGTGSVN